MADEKTPKGTTPVANSPELENLKAREKILADKGAWLDKQDANKWARENHDLPEAKRRNAVNLSEIRKAIQELSK